MHLTINAARDPDAALRSIDNDAVAFHFGAPEAAMATLRDVILNG